MKVILLNGSPRKNGNTYTALHEIEKILNENEIDTEILQLGTRAVHGCIACGSCATRENHVCVFNDDVLNEYVLKMRSADGIVIGTPVYYAGMSGSLKSFLDRAFYTSSAYFAYKPCAAISVARRAGTTTACDEIDRYFALGKMIKAPTQYWGGVFGRAEGECAKDDEGMQDMRVTARGMVWLLKVLEKGKDIPKPQKEEARLRTNFIK